MTCWRVRSLIGSDLTLTPLVAALGWGATIKITYLCSTRVEVGNHGSQLEFEANGCRNSINIVSAFVTCSDALDAGWVGLYLGILTQHKYHSTYFNSHNLKPVLQINWSSTRIKLHKYHGSDSLPIVPPLSWIMFENTTEFDLPDFVVGESMRWIQPLTP